MNSFVKSILHIYLVRGFWGVLLPSFICCLGCRCEDWSSAVNLNHEAHPGRGLHWAARAPKDAWSCPAAWKAGLRTSIMWERNHREGPSATPLGDQSQKERPCLQGRRTPTSHGGWCKLPLQGPFWFSAFPVLARWIRTWLWQELFTGSGPEWGLGAPEERGIHAHTVTDDLVQELARRSASGSAWGEGAVCKCPLCRGLILL